MTKAQIEKLISDYANELIGPGDLTNEELDQACVDEAFRVIKNDARKNLSLEIARLAREAQEAEIERLREALERLARLGGRNGNYGNSEGNDIARAALQPKEEE